MKKLSIILNVVLLAVAIFFAVYANIQTDLAKEERIQTNQLIQDVESIKHAASKEAAMAREAEAKAVMALRDAEKAKEDALEAESALIECQSSK